MQVDKEYSQEFYLTHSREMPVKLYLRGMPDVVRTE